MKFMAILVSVNVTQSNTNSTTESIPMEDQVSVTNATETMSEQGVISDQEDTGESYQDSKR